MPQRAVKGVKFTIHHGMAQVRISAGQKHKNPSLKQICSAWDSTLTLVKHNSKNWGQGKWVRKKGINILIFLDKELQEGFSVSLREFKLF